LVTWAKRAAILYAIEKPSFRVKVGSFAAIVSPDTFCFSNSVKFTAHALVRPGPARGRAYSTLTEFVGQNSLEQDHAPQQKLGFSS